MKLLADNPKISCSPTKRWTFRLLAVVIGLSPFLALEASLRIMGWKPDTPPGDPFIDFQSVRPLFVPSDDGRSMVTAANRLAFFRPESFAVHKRPNEYRIICLGGSTVQGRPYSIETSFTTWLELSLAAADAGRHWEVINCGGVSYASYRLIPILQEMLQHEPDLLILYTGHNEFLEDRSYAAIKRLPDFLAQAISGLTRLRSVQLSHRLLCSHQDAAADAVKKDLLPTEVDTLLDYQGGLVSYHRDLAWKNSAVRHFEYNLRQLVRVAQSAGIPVILVDPAVNMRDCPPFKIEDSTKISATELATCARHIADAENAIAASHEQAIELFKQAVAINPQHAGLHYQLGLRCAESERFDEARHHLQRAIEEDVCPLRIIERLSQVIRHVSLETNCQLVSVRELFESLSPGGIPGNNLFVDHVHPTFHGHQLIAARIVRALQESGIVQLHPEWQNRRDARYREHWTSLNTIYFERGRDRLAGLLKWTQGRAKHLHRQSDKE